MVFVAAVGSGLIMAEIVLAVMVLFLRAMRWSW